jgi:hypothetical protein
MSKPRRDRKKFEKVSCVPWKQGKSFGTASTGSSLKKWLVRIEFKKACHSLIGGNPEVGKKTGVIPVETGIQEYH